MSIIQRPFDLYIVIILHGINSYSLWNEGYMQISFWCQAGERQTQKLRELYVQAILRQDIGSFLPE
jgi:hypothetical protein